MKELSIQQFFLFERVNASLIEHEIMELYSNKASGYDCIPPKTLKDSVSIVKDPLTQLFNTSVKDNLFPSDLKYANVSPLFKKDDNTNKENYRPISILPTISKMFLKSNVPSDYSLCFQYFITISLWF